MFARLGGMTLGGASVSHLGFHNLPSLGGAITGRVASSQTSTNIGWGELNPADQASIHSLFRETSVSLYRSMHRWMNGRKGGFRYADDGTRGTFRGKPFCEGQVEVTQITHYTRVCSSRLESEVYLHIEQPATAHQEYGESSGRRVSWGAEMRQTY
jgi:hypothetical protein